VTRLATAYVATGDATYARKAAILLDRIADVYPTFDFKSQALLYESVRGDGYVSVWHDATIETRELAQAYDAIKGWLDGDAELVSFLASKSEQFRTPLAKKTSDDVAKNIEARILRDALGSPHKIYSNYPQQYLTVAVINTALGWPGNRDEVLKALDPIIEKSTEADGVTGEKGLANYSSYAAQRLAEFIGYYARMDETFLPEMIRRHPRLPQMYRFFIDTWCGDGHYYPLVGDTGWFAGPQNSYAGVTFDQHHFLATGNGGGISHSLGIITPSAYTLLWQLYEHTRDPAFAQIIYRANGDKTGGLPYDVAAREPAAMRKALGELIEKNGTAIPLGDVDKKQWHLAILRSGRGATERAAWLAYDVGGNHGHRNGLNLGLFALGLDLMPDFGYPPVQFGGWGSPRATWYTSTFAHNTVIVDGKEQNIGAAGQTTLWAPGDHGFSAVSVSAPAMYGGTGVREYQRTVATIDTSDTDSYVFDVFRVEGGGDHVKFFGSHFGAVAPSAYLKLEPAPDFSHPPMRNWRAARDAAPGWSAVWSIEDRYKILPPERAKDLHVRYTEFTANADAYLGESWVVAGSYNETAETWVPRVMVRRRGKDLKSSFVSLIEPYRGAPLIRKASREAAAADGAAKLKVELVDGRVDLIELTADGRLSLIRRDAGGRVIRVAACNATEVRDGDVELQLNGKTSFVQVDVGADGAASVVAGDAKVVKALRVGGQAVTVR
jgi:hypothetical protein